MSQDEKPNAMLTKDDAQMLDVPVWCMRLNEQTLEKLGEAGLPAMVSAIGYVEPETGQFLIYVLAAGADPDQTKALVERAGVAVSTYASIADPRNMPPPPKETVN